MFKNSWKNFRRRRAVSVLEYAAILFLISLVSFFTLPELGRKNRDLFDEATTANKDTAIVPVIPPASFFWKTANIQVNGNPGTSTVKSALIANEGGMSKALAVGDFRFSGANPEAFAIKSTDCDTFIGAGATCTVNVEITANVNGPYSAILSHSQVNGLVSVSGTATGFPPQLIWSNTSFRTTDPVSEHTVGLRNADVSTVSGVYPSVTGANFHFLRTTCPSVLLPDASCDIIVSMNVVQDGTYQGEIHPGTPLSPQSITGVASNIGPQIVWSDISNSLDVLDAKQNPAISSARVTLTNSGNMPATGLIPSVSGVGFTLLQTSCSSSLAPAATCVIEVQFSGRENGAYTGSIDLGSSASIGSGSQTKSLQATVSGLSPVIAWSGITSTSFNVSDPASSPAVNTVVATIRNTGTQRATGLVPAVYGTYFSLSGTTCSGTLDVNASCTMNILLSTPNNGTFSGSATLGNTATVGTGIRSQALSATVSGLGPKVVWSGITSTSFNITDPKSNPATSSAVAIITNNGNQPATGLAPTVLGEGFSARATTCASTLNAGDSCRLTIGFSATKNGTFTGSATLGSNAIAGNSSPQALTALVEGFVAPVFVTKSVDEGEEEWPYTMDIVVTSKNNDLTTLELDSGTLPPGLRLSGFKITGTPTKKSSGFYTYTLRANDAAGLSTTQTYTHTIGDVGKSCKNMKNLTVIVNNGGNVPCGNAYGLGK